MRAHCLGRLRARPDRSTSTQPRLVKGADEQENLRGEVWMSKSPTARRFLRPHHIAQPNIHRRPFSVTASAVSTGRRPAPRR